MKKPNFLLQKGIIFLFLCVFMSTARAQPGNDACTNATLLTTSISCTNTAGTIKSATAATGLPTSCGSTTTAVDVWYAFVANSFLPTVTVSGLGNKFTNGVRIEIYSGTCGSFTSIGCGKNTATPLSSLTIGNTYYVRITDYNNSTSTNGNSWAFNICITDIAGTQLDSNTYVINRTFVNVSKPTGGTFNPNDTVEVRYTICVPSTYNMLPSSSLVVPGNASRFQNYLKSPQIIDSLPIGVSYVSGSLRTATNEGVTYRSFTDVSDADQGSYTTSGGFNIINIKVRPSSGVSLDTLSGAVQTRTSAASVFSNTLSNPTPPFFWGAAIVEVIYRVKITAAYSQFINFNRGAFWYKQTIAPADAATTAHYFFPQNVLAVYQSAGSCPNGIDTSHIFENNGTFGSGKPRNRGSASSIVPSGVYGYNFTASNIGQPNDGSYSIVNNSSDSGSTSNASTTAYPFFSSNKIFGVEDVSGDHTGALNPNVGNSPVDTSASQPGGGYMVFVNASYGTNAVISQAINNICANTYYDISAWFRNMCPKCASDSLGNGSTIWGPTYAPNSGYISYPGNDSAGVKPNLAFALNDTIYYTTGDMPYDRTYTRPWVKKGFTYLSSLGGNTFTLKIINNSPGGGGNDWAMDDVTVGTCGPSLNMNFTPTVPGCKETGNTTVSLNDTVSYTFNASYIYFKWQKKTLASGVWVDVASGVADGLPPVFPNTLTAAAPTLVSGQYQFVTSLPTFTATYADSGTVYRVVAATTAANLTTSNACIYTNGATTMIKIITCGTILQTNLINFTGVVNNDYATLNWVVTGEKHLYRYDVERSNDQVNFIKIGTVAGKNLTQTSNYLLTDNQPIFGNTLYRLKMVDESGAFLYSNIILLGRNIDFKVRINENPFTDKIKAEIILPQDGVVNFMLTDCYGRIVYNSNQQMPKGYTRYDVNNPSDLSKGIYFLNVSYNGQVVQKKLMKF